MKPLLLSSLLFRKRFERHKLDLPKLAYAAEIYGVPLKNVTYLQSLRVFVGFVPQSFIDFSFSSPFPSVY